MSSGATTRNNRLTLAWVAFADCAAIDFIQLTLMLSALTTLLQRDVKRRKGWFRNFTSKELRPNYGFF